MTRVVTALLPALLLFPACGGERAAETPPATGTPTAGAPHPEQTRPAPTEPPRSPFHEEAEWRLAAGDLEGARLALHDAIRQEPYDEFAHAVLGSMELHLGNANAAARHFVDALHDRSGDCMLALALATARRRVDVATGSEKVLRDILSHPGCPSAAYGTAVERLARHADPVAAGGLLPEGGPADVAFLSARIVALDPDRPDFSALADAVHSLFRGRLTVLGDQFADISDHTRVEGHWVAEDLALLYVRAGPGLPRIPDREALGAGLDSMFDSWREGLSRVPEYAAWDIVHWTTFEDVRGRFRMDSPDRWYANLFQGPDRIIYTFAPVELDKPGAEPVRSGRVPAFDLVMTDREEGDPPPWDDRMVEAFVMKVSAFFAGSDHATDPWVEFIGDDAVGAPPGVLVKRTFVSGQEVYRIAAAEVAGPARIYRFTFAGPAEKFDAVEGGFWRFVQSLRPLEAAAPQTREEP